MSERGISTEIASKNCKHNMGMISITKVMQYHCKNVPVAKAFGLCS